MLLYKFKLQNKQSDQAYKYGKIIANGIELCTENTGDLKFPGKITVDQVSKKTYTQQPLKYVILFGKKQY